VDSFLKKYTLMYIFVSKVESGGTFWRLIFNRLLFATGFFVCVVALIVWSRYNGRTACTLLPLLLILILFKVYCHRTYDPDTRYHLRGSDRDSMISANNFNRKDRLDMRYSHPALHRKLMRPMVHGKAEHIMAQIFGHAGPARDGQGGIGMDSMQRGNAGKKIATAGFEVVQEEDMDFANFKNRAEFGDDHGGGGVLYGDDYSIMGTMTPPPGFGSPASSRPGSPVIGHQVAMASPLGTGGSAFAGSGYFPVLGPPPPRSPGFSQHSMHRPESPYDYSYTDHRSETGSVAHLLGDQRGGQPGPYRHQPHQYEEYRGVRR
jgi:cytochrome c oxidase subunit IV